MRKNKLKEKIAAGERAVNGWVAIPNAYSTEIYAAAGWDSVTIDMQHGAPEMNDLVSLLQAITLSDVTPMVRVPWNAPGYIMRALDAGAYGIVCPMINTREEAEAFVRAGRYPPLGERSFGPYRAAQYGGADYWQHANDEVLLFAMIETRQAVNNLEAILSVKGINGVYVGPSDLSMSMGKTPTLDPSEPTVLEAMDIIVKTTRKWGHIAGVHTDGPKTALKRYDEGFQMCTLINDVRLLAMAAQQAIRDVRGQGAAAKSKTY
jgi:4-hydroxy-2-oxoheptanedioate aldolase